MRRNGIVPIVTSSGIDDCHDESRVAGPGVVTGRYGTIGRVFYITDDFWPLNTTLYIRDFHGNDPLFIFYFLQTIDFATHSGKSGVPGVNRNDLHQVSVRLPTSLEEQRAIALALSDADELVESLERLIVKKRRIKQGAMQDLLTGKRRLPGFEGEWETRTLGELGRCTRGVSFDPSTDLLAIASQDSVALLRAQNVRQRILNFEDVLHVADRRVSQAQRLVSGDIVICMANGSKALVGKSAVFQGTRLGLFTIGAFMALFRPNGEAGHPRLVPYLFQSHIFRAHIDVLLAGSSINNLTPGNVESCEFNVPKCQSEQTAIATVLSDMDSEIAALESKLTKARRIKQGMMQQLLTGRIRLV